MADGTWIHIARKRDFSATPEPSGDRPGRRRTHLAGSLCRSTTPARCTGICGSSTTARWPRGRSRRASRPTRARTTSRCGPRITRSSTWSSTATSRQGQYGAGTMRIWDRGTYETHKWRDKEVMVTLPRRARAGPLRPVPDRREELDDPPDGSAAGSGPRADARAGSSRCSPAPATLPQGRPQVGVRDQVGRRARDRLRRGRAAAAGGAQRARHHAALPGAARARAGAGGPTRRCSTARWWRSTPTAGRASSASRAGCT